MVTQEVPPETARDVARDRRPVDPDDLRWVRLPEFRRVLDGVTDPFDRCQAFAGLCRINCLSMVAHAGSGHLGSSFSACDVMSWLLLGGLRPSPDGDEGLYFSSKGHDVPTLYAALIGLGRLPEELLFRFRRLGGLPGHPDVTTPGIVANTGSLGMGISKAKGLVLGDRLAGRRREIVVLTGDGELQEGQIWESLPGAAHRAMGELTVIVDHNRLQSDTWVSAVNDLGDLERRFGGCGWGVLRCAGNDPRDIDRALRRRRDEYADAPAVIVAETVKGAGCETLAATSMAPGEWRYPYHSGAPDAAVYEAALRELCAGVDEVLARHGLPLLRPARVPGLEPPVRPRGTHLPAVYGAALATAARQDRRVVALDADLLVDTGLGEFAATVPHRLVECGIAEQDMVTMAGALAAGGYLPFVHSFSCFLHARAHEQIYNNALEGRKVVYVGALAGLLPAAPGHSHQAVRDVSALAAVPGLQFVQPMNSAQVDAVTGYCLRTADSVYLRLSSWPCPPQVEALPAEPLCPGRGQVLRDGEGVLVVGSGPVVVAEMLQAAELLAATRPAPVRVAATPWLTTVDRAWLAEVTAGIETVVVVEDHFARGGLADTVARALLESGRPPRFAGIAVEGLPCCGAGPEVLDAHGLSARRLAARITELDS